MSFISVSVTSTRDLVRFRKLPASQTCVATVATSFFTLLASDSPAATQVRAGFLPALLASDARRPNQSDPVLDATLRHLFASPPNVVIVQGIVTAHQISAAWSREQKQTGQITTTAVPSGAPMRDSVFVPWALMQELEQASASHGGSDDAVAGAQEAEEVANLKIMVLSVLVYELAHWVFVRAHGYQAPSWSTVQDSMSLLTASGSVSSLQSTQSLLILPGSTTDVGCKALSACFGCTFECLAYAIGEREVIKRRTPGRRSPTLTPPIIYSLIYDTPRIYDATSMPPTHSRWIVPWKSSELYTVVSAMTPNALPGYHGQCELNRDDQPPGQVSKEYEVSLASSLTSCDTGKVNVY